MHSGMQTGATQLLSNIAAMSHQQYSQSRVYYSLEGLSRHIQWVAHNIIH